MPTEEEWTEFVERPKVAETLDTLNKLLPNLSILDLAAIGRKAAEQWLKEYHRAPNEDERRAIAIGLTAATTYIADKGEADGREQRS